MLANDRRKRGVGMRDLLPCNLFETGTKFIVTDVVKETTFSPGTTSFMSFMREADGNYQDVVIIKAVTIRRGKGGMDRINVDNMLIPVFDDPRMLEHEDYLPVKKRYYVHIEEIPMDACNVLHMDDMDFLGWACARAVNLNYLTTSMARKGAPKLWPKNGNTNPLGIAIRFPEFFDSNKEETIDKFSKDQAFRLNLITHLRRLEAASIKCNVLYQKQVSSAILNSARFVSYTNKNYFKVVDQKQAENTIAFYEDRIKWLNKMSIDTSVKKNG